MAFDGGFPPPGPPDVGDLPHLTSALIEELRGILGGNSLRVMPAVVGS